MRLQSTGRFDKHAKQFCLFSYPQDGLMPAYKSIRFEATGHVTRITLNRPEMLNAIDEEMHVEFLEALLAVRGDIDVRAVVLAAEGKAFSAGGDLNEIVELQRDAAKRMRLCETGTRIIHALIDIPVPVVVALQGDAMGLGASIALGGDIIVASKTARIADPHVKVGLVAGDGGCLFWPASMGMHRARRYLLTGDLMSAEDAWRFGLVTDLVDTAEECLPAAGKIADKIAGLPPIAVRGTKRSLNALVKARAREAFDISMAYEQQAAASEDVLEAVAAFKEKRKPVYRNR
jgi:enoyl-CoA hydratase